MGCGGCLGPKKQIVQVYVVLIDQIHLEAPKVTSSSNLDLYMAIKEKITKKGYLRKLNDYLNSHRRKIPQSLTYNFKIIAQKKDIQNRFAGIIIADSLIEITYKNNQQKSNQIMQQEILDSSFSSNQYRKDLLKSSLQETQKRGHKRNPSFMSFPGEISSQINTRFDQQFLRMINYLLEHQNRMYHRILLSIEKFCQKHPDNIRCQYQVWKAIHNIITSLQKNIEIPTSLRAYYLLFSKLKEHPTEQMRSHQNLQIVINSWLNSNRENQTAMLYESCREIIKMYINRCLASQDFIYESIMKIYDGIQFQPKKVQALENLYEEAVFDLEIKGQFFRGIFNYLLSYISVTHEDIVDKKWFSMALGSNYDHLRACYKNILVENVKIEGFKVLNRWISKNYVKLQEVVLYNFKSLIFVYSSNILAYFQRKNICDVLMDQFFKIITKMTEQSQQIFKRRIIEQFKEPNSSQKQQQILLKLLKQMLYRSRNRKQDVVMYLIPIKKQYDREIKLQILRLSGFVVQNAEGPIDNERKSKYLLCQFMYTICDNIINIIDSLSGKHQIICSAISFSKILITKYDRAILVSLVRIINQKFLNQNQFSYQSQFFMKYFSFELAHILFKSFKVPDQIFKIVQEISPHKNNLSIEKKIQQYMRQQDKEQIQMKKLLEASTYNHNDEKQLYEIFMYHFNQESKKSKKKHTGSHLSRENSLHFKSQYPFDEYIEIGSPKKNLFTTRRSSIRNDSEDMDVNDKSFEQVLDIVNQ